MTIKLETKYVPAIKEDEIVEQYSSKVSDIFQSLQDRTADGIEMTGWLRWVHRDHSVMLKAIKDIKDQWLEAGIQVVVVIGTGGSYVGAKAGINFINEEAKLNNFQFIFVPSFSERFCGSILRQLKGKKFAIVVVSKSGTTLEAAVAFRILREELLKQEHEKYYNFVIAVTDKEKGVLRPLANDAKFHIFEIEDDIGGRYSTLTAVGLVPMVLGGISGEEVLKGAKQCYDDNFHLDISKNIPALYAAYRHYFFTSKGLRVEAYASYDPQLDFTLEKMKQLFAESEAKDNKGLFPVILNFTPDLHSVGQLLQDGFKCFFETTVLVTEPKYSIAITKSSFNDDDGLDWLSTKTLKQINNSAFQGTVEAHSEVAGVNNLVIELKDWSAYTFGYFYFWLSLSAMFSSYLFEVNPFTQPGVEAYKKRMFDILKK